MTTLIFSTGGCPLYPFYSFKRGPWYPVFRENPSREVATKDHSSSNPAKGNPPDLKTKVDVSKVDVKGFPTQPSRVFWLGGAVRNCKGFTTKQCAWLKHGSATCVWWKHTTFKLSNTVKRRVEELLPNWPFWKHDEPNLRPEMRPPEALLSQNS